MAWSLTWKPPFFVRNVANLKEGFLEKPAVETVVNVGGGGVQMVADAKLGTAVAEGGSLLSKGASVFKSWGGIIGTAVGTATTLLGANNAKKKTERQVILQYKQEIAAARGIRPDQVGFSDLRKAAKKNKGLQQVLDTTTGNRNSMVRVGMATLVVGLVTGAFTGGLGFLASMAIGIPATMITGFVAGKADNAIFGKDMNKTGHALVQQLVAKRAAGQQVSQAEVFNARLAINPDAAKAIKKEFGAEFAQLDDATRQQIMTGKYAKMGEAAAIMARNINDGARPEGILFGVVKRVQMAPVGQAQAAAPAMPAMSSAELAQIRARMQNAGVNGAMDADAIARVARDDQQRSFASAVRSNSR